MQVIKFFHQVFQEWSADKVSRLAASLAYFTVFSLAPLLIVIIAVAGIVFDANLVQQQIIAQLSALVGPAGAQLINELLNNSRTLRADIVAAIIGVVMILLGASGIVGELKDALNTIWNVAPKPGQSIFWTLKERVLSFAFVLAVGFLLLASLILSTGLTALGKLVGSYLQDWLWIARASEFAISFFGITLLFALLFKFLPDARVRWRDVWVGAAITALLFTLGKYAIGLYLGNSNIATPFGAAGSLVILFVWIYYAAHILFLGAEITQVYANRFGAGIQPASDAVPLSDAARVEQGTLKPNAPVVAATTPPSASAPLVWENPLPETRGRFNPFQLFAAAIGLRVFALLRKLFAMPMRLLKR